MDKFKKCTLIFIIALMLLVCSGCTIHRGQRSNNDEWISPDGVHYWYWFSGNAGFMAPRYDHDGNLIID